MWEGFLLPYLQGNQLRRDSHALSQPIFLDKCLFSLCSVFLWRMFASVCSSIFSLLEVRVIRSTTTTPRQKLDHFNWSGSNLHRLPNIWRCLSFNTRCTNENSCNGNDEMWQVTAFSLFSENIGRRMPVHMWNLHEEVVEVLIVLQ